MEYYTADFFNDAERLGAPYQIKGKLYTRVKCRCGRCGGTGVFKTFGTCYECNGSGYVIKETRLFTKEEKEAYQKDKAAGEEAFEREQLTRENEAKRNWLERNNFDKDGNTFIVVGDSYSIKDKLKSLGFKYSDYIKWHCAIPCEDWDFMIKKINVNDFYHWVPGVKGYLISEEGKDKLKRIYAEVPSNGEWIGNYEERIQLKVTLIGTRAFDSVWGKSTLYFFETENKDKLIWKTTTTVSFPKDTLFTIAATIKKHTFDQTGSKVTYIQRVRLEESNEV